MRRPPTGARLLHMTHATSNSRRRGLNAAELSYLRTHRLGRVATVDEAGQPQVNPVGLFPQDDGTILTGGIALAQTKRWRNLHSNPKLAVVVDDTTGPLPHGARGVEVRGSAELLTGPHNLAEGLSDELIRIHPEWVHSWGLSEAEQ